MCQIHIMLNDLIFAVQIFHLVHVGAYDTGIPSLDLSHLAITKS
jgi:hypothetical protein